MGPGQGSENRRQERRRRSVCRPSPENLPATLLHARQLCWWPRVDVVEQLLSSMGGDSRIFTKGTGEHTGAGYALPERRGGSCGW